MTASPVRTAAKTPSIGTLRRRHRYLAICLTAVQEATAYRFTAVFVVMLGFFWAFILYFLWEAAYADTAAGTIGGYTWPQMRTYIVLAFGINSLIGWNVAGPMQEGVRTGDIVLEMVRPLNYCAAQISRYLGYSAVEGGVALLLTMVIGILFLGLQPPQSALAGVVFVFALVGGFLTRALFLFLCSLLTFYVLGSGGIMWAQQAVTLVFSGALVPIALMPIWLQLVTNVLPLRGIVATPLAIYLGKATGWQMVGLLGVQIGWLILLWLVADRAWRHAFRSVDIQGG